MTTILYSISVGRPPYARKKLGHTVSWAAWWKSPLGARPDLCGGARTREEVSSEVVRQVQRFVADIALEAVAPRWCRDWRRQWRDELGRHAERHAQRRFNVDQAQAGFAGFDANLPRHRTDRPEPPTARDVRIDPAFEALGLGSSPSEVDVRRAFRARARDLHPDRGGSEVAFKKLNDSYQRAMKVVRGEVSASRFVYPGPC